MLTVEFEASTDMPDDDYPLFAISYLYFTRADESEEISLRMYDAFCSGYISDGRMNMRADGCTALSKYGDEDLSDDDVISMLQDGPIDVEVDFGGRYLMNSGASDYEIWNPEIIVSSRDSSHYLFTLVEPEKRPQFGLLYDEEVIEDLGPADDSIALNVSSIKPF